MYAISTNGKINNKKRQKFLHTDFAIASRMAT